ncbi:rab-GTPase-TBC domain-containing protein [Mycena epipterygia]|nr:rab-GTPase-TBC domain-containing protein [Mycena epipterygia]
MDSEKATSLEFSSDWEEYRRMSLSPGGFGDKRTEIWPKVLHAQPLPPFPEGSTADESSCHPDERQIRLDTERSFVLYPVDSKTDKDTLQSELHDLLVEIFRKHPKLNYFQGYHDIITVLLLTLPRELQLPCAEQLSLQRVRDSMGTTLDPVLGLLRVMKNLLRVADPKYAELLERTSPLPYYALPNLLTLFSHDMPTLPLIQHVFDYLLCRPPIFVVYLASAIVLSRKADVERLEEEGEEGMMHSLLSALPEIVDDNDSSSEEVRPKVEETTFPDIKQETSDLLDLDDDNTSPEVRPKDEPENNIPDIKQETSDLLQGNIGDDDATAEPSGDLAIGQEAAVGPDVLVAEPDLPLTSETKPELPLSRLSDTSTEKSDSSPQANRRKISKPKPHSLTDILNASDALYEAHPPISLQLSSIMGPQSVVFTWSTRASDMPASDEAECMVQRLDLIVYPEAPVVENDDDKSATKRRRKRFKRRAGPGTAMLVGAGLVLGVAVAVSVYGARQGGDPARDWRKLGRLLGNVFTGASERLVRYRT